MILRLFPILITFGAVWILWLGYGELKSLRGTVLWEYRYIVFTVAVFLGLSGLEWAVSWTKKKFTGDEDSH